MTSVLRRITRTPLVGPLLRACGRRLGGRRPFPGSQAYWERRYRRGGTSGAGSGGALARFKAEVLNGFVAEHGVDSVLELGCGDGGQLALARYPRYLGLDVSPRAVALCRERFGDDASKRFAVYPETKPQAADLALSLDVIYHLVEDAVFERHMRDLFAHARRYVIIYASNEERPGDKSHVRHRRFTDWVAGNAPDWRLVERIANPHPYSGDNRRGSHADFYLFARAA